jgi:hypothetical protein
MLELHMIKKQILQKMRGGFLLGLFSVFTLPVFSAEKSREPFVTFLNAGFGDSILVQISKD